MFAPRRRYLEITFFQLFPSKRFCVDTSYNMYGLPLYKIPR